MLLENKVIFLTGAACGIGRECALACVREGAQVAIVDVDGEQAEATATEIGGPALAVQCDVSDGASVNRAVAATLERFGRIDSVHR